MGKNLKDERSRLIRLSPVPKVIDMEEIVGEDDKVEDGVSSNRQQEI